MNWYSRNRTVIVPILWVLFFTACLLLAFCGCAPTRYWAPDLAPRLAASDALVAQRQEEAAAYSVQEKAQIFEQRLEEFALPWGGVCEFQGQGADVEISHHRLGLQGIRLRAGANSGNLDRTLFGLEAFGMPFADRVAADGTVLDATAKANVYPQALWAYSQVLAATDSPLAVEQGCAAVRYALDAELFDAWGNPSEALSLLVAVEFGLCYGDSELRERCAGIKRGSIAWSWQINFLTLRILDAQFPTYSSTWLNHLKLHALCTLSSDTLYRDAFTRLFRDTQEAQNPFWEALYCDASGLPLRPWLWDVLEEFPISLDTREVLNSPHKELPVRPGRFLKNKAEVESVFLLPVWRRPLDYMLWKRNQFEMDGNIGKAASAYPALDYLLLYSMLGGDDE